MAEAEKSDGVIEFVPQIGDFIATDEPLFNLYGGTASLDDGDLMSTVAFGRERTLEQDPTFAFPDYRRHRAQGPVTCHQGSDNRRDCDRPASSPATESRKQESAYGRNTQQIWPTGRNFSNSELGRLCASRIH